MSDTETPEQAAAAPEPTVTEKLENAVEEARAISDAVGDRLLALEVGNEPDLFAHAGHRAGR